MLKNLIIKNRSYRRFKNAETIDMETLTELIDLARLSPSARNAQPLRYIISNTAEKNDKIFANLSWAADLNWSGPAQDERPSAYIILLSDTMNNLTLIDSGIAARTIMLGATEKDLGGCILGAINKPNLKDTLNIPDQYEIILVLALGKPGETVVLEEAKADDVKYWRDDKDAHHVPKRKLDDIILKLKMGYAKKIILLSSSCSNAYVWANQINYFADKYEMIYHDLTPYDTLDAMVQSVIDAYLDAYCLAGLSLGGIVAQQVMIKKPDFCDKLILISTLSHAVDADFYLSLIKSLQKQNITIEKFADLFAEVCTTTKDHVLLAKIKQMPIDIGIEGCINHMKANIGYKDFTDKLSAITAKTLVIHGAEDTATPLSDHEQIVNNIRGAKLAIVPGCGHLCTLEKPNEVNKLIEGWLT